MLNRKGIKKLFLLTITFTPMWLILQAIATIGKIFTNDFHMVDDFLCLRRFAVI